jgi:hypothetical protein
LNPAGVIETPGVLLDRCAHVKMSNPDGPSMRAEKEQFTGGVLVACRGVGRQGAWPGGAGLPRYRPTETEPMICATSIDKQNQTMIQPIKIGIKFPAAVGGGRPAGGLILGRVIMADTSRESEAIPA